MKTHIAISCCHEVADIINPKLIPHGMTVFNFYRIYFDGRMIRLSSDQKWTEHFFQKNYMNKMTVPQSYLVKPLNYYIWLTEDCPELLLDAALNFNTSNGISIAEKHREYIDYYCFATTTNNTRIINHFYLGNLDLLHQYGLYFKDKANKLIKKAEKSTIQLLNFDTCQLDSRPNKHSLIKLSHRESECAQLLLQGLKYKEIAKELKVSPRTIECYIDNLKSKLQCQNKAEIIIKLFKLNQSFTHNSDI